MEDQPRRSDRRKKKKAERERRQQMMREAQKAPLPQNVQQNQANQPLPRSHSQMEIDFDADIHPQPVPQRVEEEKQIEMELDKPPVNQGKVVVELPHQRRRGEEISMSPLEFLKKIPNKEVMRDFLTNEMRLYCPLLKNMTTKWISDVIQEKKFLLAQSQVQRVYDVPQSFHIPFLFARRYKDFSAIRVWQSIMQQPNKDEVLKYMPDSMPSKQYMMDVVNTLSPGIIKQAVLDLQKKKEAKKIADTPVVISSFFANRLKKFKSIRSNQQMHGINRVVYMEYPQCVICLQQLRPSHAKSRFKCSNKKHIGHVPCVNSYYNSRMNEKYLCPMRCQKEKK